MWTEVALSHEGIKEFIHSDFFIVDWRFQANALECTDLIVLRVNNNASQITQFNAWFEVNETEIMLRLKAIQKPKFHYPSH